MRRNEEKLRKITQHLYKFGVNTSGRAKSYPDSNENISKDAYEIDRINMGAETIVSEYFVRASFRGSSIWYSIPVAYGKEDAWWSNVKFVTEFYRDSASEGNFDDEYKSTESPEGWES